MGIVYPLELSIPRFGGSLKLVLMGVLFERMFERGERGVVDPVKDVL